MTNTQLLIIYWSLITTVNHRTTPDSNERKREGASIGSFLVTAHKQQFWTSLGPNQMKGTSRWMGSFNDMCQVTWMSVKGLHFGTDQTSLESRDFWDGRLFRMQRWEKNFADGENKMQPGKWTDAQHPEETDGVCSVPLEGLDSSLNISTWATWKFIFTDPQRGFLIKRYLQVITRWAQRQVWQALRKVGE